jgi:hypothetical protein
MKDSPLFSADSHRRGEGLLQIRQLNSPSEKLVLQLFITEKWLKQAHLLIQHITTAHLQYWSLLGTKKWMRAAAAGSAQDERVLKSPLGPGSRPRWRACDCPHCTKGTGGQRKQLTGRGSPRKQDRRWTTVWVSFNLV